MGVLSLTTIRKSGKGQEIARIQRLHPGQLDEACLPNLSGTKEERAFRAPTFKSIVASGEP